MSQVLTADAMPAMKAASFTQEDKMLVEMRFSNQKKSTGIAYLLLCLTLVGHNFYLGRIGRGILQFLLCFVVVGFFWVLADLFTLAGTVRRQNEGLYNDITLSVLRG
jgi:TM2 domain-containing membrane protein YozV